MNVDVILSRNLIETWQQECQLARMQVVDVDDYIKIGLPEVVDNVLESGDGEFLIVDAHLCIRQVEAEITQFYFLRSHAGEKRHTVYI